MGLFAYFSGKEDRAWPSVLKMIGLLILIFSVIGFCLHRCGQPAKTEAQAWDKASTLAIPIDQQEVPAWNECFMTRHPVLLAKDGRIVTGYVLPSNQI